MSSAECSWLSERSGGSGQPQHTLLINCFQEKGFFVEAATFWKSQVQQKLTVTDATVWIQKLICSLLLAYVHIDGRFAVNYLHYQGK